MDINISYCIGRLSAGKGCCISPGGVGGIKESLYLIPLSVVEEGVSGVLIVQSGRAAWEWKPGEALTVWRLLEKGFLMRHAKAVIQVLEAIKAETSAERFALTDNREVITHGSESSRRQ